MKTLFDYQLDLLVFLDLLTKIFKDLIRCKIVFTYVDDIIIRNENDEQAFENLKETLIWKKHYTRTMSYPLTE